MNTNFKYIFLNLLLFIFLSSCEKNIEIEYPAHREQIVLTGLIQPDSILKIRLQKTLPVLSKDIAYPSIVDANVFCYENNKKIGQLKHTQNGFYVLNYFPKEGSVYKIETTYGNKVITAEDTIPTFSDINIAIGKNNTNNPNQNPDVFLNIKRNSKSYIWLSAILVYKNTKSETQIKSAVIRSSFPIFDTFNSYKSIDGTNSFDKYARLNPEFLGDWDIKFTVANQTSVIKQKGDYFYFQVSDVSYNYDRYLKSSLLAFETRPSENGTIKNPFSEPVSVFSNVKNGIGILGAIRGRMIILKEIN